MTEIEDRLRRELTQEAERAQPGQLRPLREPRPRALGGGVRRLAPLAAAVAVVVVVAAVWLAGSAVFRGPASTAGPGAGMPRFYVVVTGTPNLSAVVHDSRTGRMVSTIPLPGRPAGGPWIAAAGDDRTFAVPLTEGPHGSLTKLAVLRISAAGTEQGLNLLRVRLPARATISGIALAPGGGKVALALKLDSVTPRHATGEIMVFSLATGAARAWTTRVVHGSILDLVWTEGGRYLGFFWERAFVVEAGQPPGQERLLDTTAPGSDLLASRVIATATKAGIGFLSEALLFADGHGMIALGLRPQALAPPQFLLSATLARLAVPGGRVIRRYPTMRVKSCNLLSASGDGAHVLLQCPAFERMDRGHLTRLPAIGSDSAAAW
jgi:hypothetical protein